MGIVENYRIEKEFGTQKKRKFGRAFLVSSKLNPLHRGVLKTLSKTEFNTHLQDRLRNERHFSFELFNLPSVLDFEETENEIFLLLEYKKGITLDQFWETVKRKDRIKTLKQLIHAMEIPLNELKARDIVHGDLKPSNILIHELDDQLTVHLIDFGLALDIKHFDDRKILFPLGYAAPELILNRLDCVDHTTDLFALGITIWRIFSGTLPLMHPNPSIYTNLQLVHPLPEHQTIPDELWKILNKMCLKHAFKTAPNLLESQEVATHLIANNQLRYQDVKSIRIDLDQLENRNWLNTILYGILGRN